jgi:hypothetical protein
MAGLDSYLLEEESMLSINKVTGVSLNFPIADTCIPTKVCIKTCYFARSGSSWPAALKRQYRLYNFVKSDPILAAENLALEIKNRAKPLSFIRWNGGGDLFYKSVVMINHFATLMPSLPIWVVTRTPKYASLIEQNSNVFVHFSIDAFSKKRRFKFEQLRKKTRNYFYSYQCDLDEEPTPSDLQGISVVFYDKYKLPRKLPKVAREIICPLNMKNEIEGVCESCRRCFDGSAVKHSRNQAGNHDRKRNYRPRKIT